MKSQSIQYLQVGQGRMGQLIAQQLASHCKHSLEVQFCRVDPVTGLSIASIPGGTVHVSNLIICIAPGSAKKWQWQTIFKGLEQQVKRGEVVIEQLVFVSSTRVYDGVLTGYIEACDKPVAVSERALGLLSAERCLQKLASNIAILRCCGLVGAGYHFFEQLLKAPGKKVRFAIDVNSVAQKVVEFLLEQRPKSQLLLLTDGYCYFNGDRLLLEQVKFLSTKHRILKNSEYSIDIKKPG